MQSKPLNKSHLDEDIIFSGSVVAFIFMVTLAFLGAVFVYALRRAKRFQQREARRMLNKPIIVKVDNKKLDMSIVDISMMGAKIEHFGGIAGHDSVSILIAQAWHAGQVKWSNDHYAGIRFKKPLDIDVIAEASGE